MMPSRRLVDGLLVAVARRVQRWADRILTERDGMLQAVHEAPSGRDDSDETEPPDSDDDGDGPPAHWLEMVRARAPHLLSRREPAPWPGSPSAESWPPSTRSPAAEPPTAD
ncbi:MAG TPA: hypothetical protein VN253_01560, partial [Kofleriaceae bacterium]|nr:hypothetical protein [Kofleriaceae bacterium]